MVSLDIIKTPTGILKCINLFMIIITVCIFYSTYNGWTQFIGTTIVSGLVYIFVLLLTYILGGMAIQKTFYELFMNTYFAIMFFSSAVVAWVHGEQGGIPVSTGIFCFFCFFFFAADIYYALVNAGVFSRAESGVSHPHPTMVPPPTININEVGSFPTSVINTNAGINGPATIGSNY